MLVCLSCVLERCAPAKQIIAYWGFTLDVSASTGHISQHRLCVSFILLIFSLLAVIVAVNGLSCVCRMLSGLHTFGPLV